jgi:hypothetical protein
MRPIFINEPAENSNGGIDGLYEYTMCKKYWTVHDVLEILDCTRCARNTGLYTMR